MYTHVLIHLQFQLRSIEQLFDESDNRIDCESEEQNGEPSDVQIVHFDEGHVERLRPGKQSLIDFPESFSHEIERKLYPPESRVRAELCSEFDVLHEKFFRGERLVSDHSRDLESSLLVSGKNRVQAASEKTLFTACP